MAEAASDRRRQAERHGRRSETAAVVLLMLKGYRIIARRARTPLGEIDLVALSPRGAVCFVEVKARDTARNAVESLSARQRERIARAARAFLALRPRLSGRPVRFDMIAVARGRLPRHIADAWRPQGG